MKDIIKPIAVLAGICLVVTAVLAYINLITSPIITAAEEAAAEQAKMEVMPGAKSFEAVSIELPEGVTEAYIADNGGYVFMLSTKGYGGEIKLICGVNADGSVAGISTLSHKETSGIGSKVVEDSSGYRENFYGKTADNYSEVDAVTGATISSKAYKKALDSAFEAYELAKEAK